MERAQLASGSTTVDVHLIKVSDRKLEGFVRFTLRDEESKRLGVSEITESCEATMAVDSSDSIWKCHPLN